MDYSNNPNKKAVVTLDNWSGYFGGALQGTRGDHPVLGPGPAWCHTSKVVATDGETYAETLNTFYKLGPKYEKPAVLAPDIGEEFPS